MLNRLLTLLISSTSCFITATAAAAPPPPAVEVMILGSHHFASPGLDTHNIRTDSVLTPARQAQLADVAQALVSKFKPTQVMVEMEGTGPDLTVDSFKRFTPALLASDPNEIVQLGFRIAHLARLPAVQGIDVQPKAGEPDYYPYDVMQAQAAKLGQTEVLKRANAPLAAWAANFETMQKSGTMAQLLMHANSAATLRTVSQPYFEFLALGDGDAQQAGAELDARWYLRNAKIFGKLIPLTKPGDRVLVVYGFGHAYWLRHFASEMPGYKLVDPVPYLKRVAAVR